MVMKLKHIQSHRHMRMLLAISISGLFLAPVAMADPAAPAATPPAVQGGWNPYATPGAVPPPPGPYGPPPGMAGQNFRPDADLDGSRQAMPPGMPAEFSGRNGQGPLTRQQFNKRQDEHRKQLEQYYQQREAEMNRRVEEMQKRMDAMEAQSEAEFNRQRQSMSPPDRNEMRVPEDVQKRWEQQKADQDKRWEQQKADQEQRMQQMRAEHEKRLEQMKARQNQRMQAQQQYRPQTEAPGQQSATTNQAPAPQQPAASAPPVPAYGYPQRGYGYGYPAQGYGYRAPGWGYPPYPAPAPGGQPPAR